MISHLISRIFNLKGCLVYYILSFVNVSIPVHSIIEDLPVGGRAIGMGSAYVAVAQGAESVYYNPAGLSFSKGVSLSLFASRPYGLRELTYETISAVLPSPFGNFGINLQTYGYHLYRENTIALGWGYHYHKRVYYGILCRMNQLRIKNYGSSCTLMIDIGCLLLMSNNILAGISITNLNNAGIKGQNEPLPQMTRVGISYQPLNEVTFAIELDKDTRFPVEMKGGIEFRPLHEICLRFGFGREPSNFSSGIGLAWDSFSIDYAFTMHPVLGTTHQGSFNIVF